MIDAELLPGYVTVAEAASRLGVTADAVRRLIRAKELAAERIGRSYLLRAQDVERRVDLAPASGRRLTAAHAWGLLALAAGDPAPWLDRATRHRLRRLLDERGLAGLRSRLTARARRLSYRAHPSQLTRLRSDPAVMLAGVSAASQLKLGLLAGEMVDGYVDELELESVVNRHHLRASRDPNVVLRVVPRFTDRWARPHVAPVSAVVLDLLDDPDPRTREVAEQALAKLGA
jgi:excisionase family DNA binding protein